MEGAMRRSNKYGNKCHVGVLCVTEPANDPAV